MLKASLPRWCATSPMARRTHPRMAPQSHCMQQQFVKPIALLQLTPHCMHLIAPHWLPPAFWRFGIRSVPRMALQSHCSGSAANANAGPTDRRATTATVRGKPDLGHAMARATIACNPDSTCSGPVANAAALPLMQRPCR